MAVCGGAVAATVVLAGASESATPLPPIAVSPTEPETTTVPTTPAPTPNTFGRLDVPTTTVAAPPPVTTPTTAVPPGATPTTLPGSPASDHFDDDPNPTPTHPFEPIGRVDTRDGTGYWEFDRWGTIRPSGNARMFGHLGAKQLTAPIVSMDSTPSDAGYILAAADGGLFMFGDARFFGSPAIENPVTPMRSISVTETGFGYTITDELGKVYAFGDAVPTP